MERYGPHLLGRIYEPDARDYKLGAYLPAKVALPTYPVVWNVSKILDQRDTSHCVGFAAAAFGIADPVNDPWGDAEGHALYYEAKAIDGDPQGENGTSVRSGIRALKQRGRINAYAFTASIDEVKAWVMLKGPLVCGTVWYEAMFTPVSGGFVRPGGAVPALGHAYLCTGYDPNLDTYFFQNSWGSEWGLGGRFKMHGADFQFLLSRLGEACTAVELPLNEPAPPDGPGAVGCLPTVWNVWGIIEHWLYEMGRTRWRTRNARRK